MDGSIGVLCSRIFLSEWVWGRESVRNRVPKKIGFSEEGFRRSLFARLRLDLRYLTPPTCHTTLYLRAAGTSG
jgi:hypothetical protein